MGQLVARRYPTKLLLKAADHTYVECGTGTKGWSCWGGKTGGTLLRVGTGSTRRADTIAEPDERAGITCYLINGVCHQAANRILLPAGITVLGAHGYSVSSAMFGTYGRPSGFLGFCKAPFNQHGGVSGDLPECLGPTGTLKSTKAHAAPGKTSTAKTAAQRRYLRGVLKIYSEASWMFTAESVASSVASRDLEDFHVELFIHQARFHLGERLRKTTEEKLRDIRRSTERSRLKVEEYYSKREISADRFVEEFNRETVVFQFAVAGVLTEREYRRLFDLARGQVVTLADPEIVEKGILPR